MVADSEAVIYLSGGAVSVALTAGHPQLGVMLTPQMGHTIGSCKGLWAADTGCFANPEAFKLDAYLRWLSDRAHLGRCLFATAPDVVGDACETWERSKDALPLIREIGLPAALVAQDGIEAMAIPWDFFDCLFIGGTTAWKLSEHAFGLASLAKARGKWAHMGRVNSWPRFRAAHAAGFDSADGTFLKYGPNQLMGRLTRWLEQSSAQPGLAGRKGRVIVQTHRLKTWPDAFDAVVRGVKKAEFRKDDRGFQVGDELLLERWNPDTEEYTGDVVRVEITHILRGPVFGIPAGYAMLSVE